MTLFSAALNVVMLSVLILIVIMLNVVASRLDKHRVSCVA